MYSKTKSSLQFPGLSLPRSKAANKNNKLNNGSNNSNLSKSLDNDINYPPGHTLTLVGNNNQSNIHVNNSISTTNLAIMNNSSSNPLSLASSPHTPYAMSGSNGLLSSCPSELAHVTVRESLTPEVPIPSDPPSIGLRLYPSFNDPLRGNLLGSHAEFGPPGSGSGLNLNEINDIDELRRNFNKEIFSNINNTSVTGGSSVIPGPTTSMSRKNLKAKIVSPEVSSQSSRSNSSGSSRSSQSSRSNSSKTSHSSASRSLSEATTHRSDQRSQKSDHHDRSNRSRQDSQLSQRGSARNNKLDSSMISTSSKMTSGSNMTRGSRGSEIMTSRSADNRRRTERRKKKNLLYQGLTNNRGNRVTGGGGSGRSKRKTSNLDKLKLPDHSTDLSLKSKITNSRRNGERRRLLSDDTEITIETESGDHINGGISSMHHPNAAHSPVLINDDGTVRFPVENFNTGTSEAGSSGSGNRSSHSSASSSHSGSSSNQQQLESKSQSQTMFTAHSQLSQNISKSKSNMSSRLSGTGSATTSDSDSYINPSSEDLDNNNLMSLKFPEVYNNGVSSVHNHDTNNLNLNSHEVEQLQRPVSTATNNSSQCDSNITSGSTIIPFDQCHLNHKGFTNSSGTISTQASITGNNSTTTTTPNLVQEKSNYSKPLNSYNIVNDNSGRRRRRNSGTNSSASLLDSGGGKSSGGLSAVDLLGLGSASPSPQKCKGSKNSSDNSNFNLLGSGQKYSRHISDDSLSNLNYLHSTNSFPQLDTPPLVKSPPGAIMDNISYNGNATNTGSSSSSSRPSSRPVSSSMSTATGMSLTFQNNNSNPASSSKLKQPHTVVEFPVASELIRSNHNLSSGLSSSTLSKSKRKGPKGFGKTILNWFKGSDSNHKLSSVPHTCISDISQDSNFGCTTTSSASNANKPRFIGGDHNLDHFQDYNNNMPIVRRAGQAWGSKVDGML